MSLITDIFAHPIDEGYAQEAERRKAAGEPRSTKTTATMSRSLLAGLLAFGVLLGIAALQVRQDAGFASAERESLIQRIEATGARVDELEQTQVSLEREIVEIEAGQLDSIAAAEGLRESLALLQGATGTGPVQGPGIVVQLTDAEGADAAEPGAAESAVLDLDIQQVVNGLWAAGAEAVSVNDQRVTPLTAIRSANNVILVNYRPLSSPYEVSAIGDSRTMARHFLDGPGGDWLMVAASTAGIRFDIRSEPSLTLPAASAALRVARPEEVP